jgi:hypothetical protein
LLVQSECPIIHRVEVQREFHHSRAACVSPRSRAAQAS